MFKNYLLTAWKVYTRRKLFTAINLLCITLTLGVLLVVTALLQEAFFPRGVEGKSDRFVQVNTMVSEGPDGNSTRISPLGYRIVEQYFRTMKTPQLVAATTGPRTVSVYQADRVTEVMLRRTDAEYWKVLDFNVLEGRLPSADDVGQGRFVVVLNQSTARKLFPGAKAVGQPLNVGGQQFRVLGVVRDEMQLNAYADIWAPTTTEPSTAYRDEESGDFAVLLLGANASDVPRMQAEVAGIAGRIKFKDPKEFSKAYVWGDTKMDVFARGIFNNAREPDSGAGTMLAVIVLLMLFFMLLPALNLVNLNTGRILERSSEIGVRKAFGASSRTLVVQFVVENILLCLVGGALGLVFAKGALMWLEQSGLIPYLRVDIAWPVLFYAFLIAVTFGLLSGVIPAWKMSRLHPVQALKGAA